MSNQETEKKTSTLPPIYGWRSEIAGGRIVEVTIDQEKLRQDLLTEGRARGYDPDALQQLASAFSVKTEGTKDPDEISQADVLLVAPLGRSMFKAIFNYPTFPNYNPGLGNPIVPNEQFGFFRQENHLKQIDPQTPDEVIALNVRTRLEENWRHERAHLLAMFTLNPEEYKEWITKRSEINAAIEASLIWLRLGTSFLPSLVDFALTRHIHVLVAGVSLLTSWLITKEIKGSMDTLVYRANPSEKEAYWEEFNTGNLSGIFDVRIVNRC